MALKAAYKTSSQRWGAIFRALLISVSIVLLSACFQQINSNDKQTNQSQLSSNINPIGYAYFNEQCASCHGENGEGTEQTPSLINCKTCQQDVLTLQERIVNSMPFNDPSSCLEDCAKYTAEYILAAFNGIDIVELEAQRRIIDSTYLLDQTNTAQETGEENLTGSESNNESENDNFDNETVTQINNILSGKDLYIAKCQTCHGSSGEGNNYAPSLQSCDSCQKGFDSLSQRIADTMPLNNATNCDNDCSALIANYILSTFTVDATDIVSVNTTIEPEQQTDTIENTNESNNDIVNIQQSQTNSVTEEDQQIDETLATGHTAYMEKCASCHGTQGTGSEGAPSLVSCAACGSGIDELVKRIVNTMPLNNATACDKECAQPIAEYILTNFKEDTTSISEQLFSHVIQLDASNTLRKAALNLVGRLPNQGETLQVKELGEQGLEQALNDMMQEAAFYQRLIEIYNDILLQNKYLLNERAISLLHDKDYPTREWFKTLDLCRSDCATEQELAERKRYYRLRDAANDAIAQEIYHLITYIVKNNKPFSEILTANYTMVNYYSARSYGLEEQLNFRKLDVNDANYPEDSKLLNDDNYIYDPSDFQPVQLNDIPHSGILTSIVYLNRFPTTKTNRNRHRAKVVYSQFLDTDILAIGDGRPDITKSLSSTTPTLDNPMCTVCHSVMDPVAATFQNWDNRGRYRPTRLNNGWHTDMLPSGFNGETMPLAGNIDNSLQWLGKQIVQDVRFARATIKTLFKGLTGQAPLSDPTDELAENDPTKQAYLAQRQMLNKAEMAFINSNYNIRDAIKSLITGPWFRTGTLNTDASTTEFKKIGAVRLLTPEMLDRKITNTLGINWEINGNNRLNSENSNSFRILYGGIDSNLITQRISNPNGLMITVQRRMASEISCKAVPLDFYRPANKRLLLPYVETTMQPSLAENAEDIKNNITYLHNKLWGEDTLLTETEIEASYQLLMDLHQTGLDDLASDNSWKNRNLDWNCGVHKDPQTGLELSDEKKIRYDEQYVIRAWMGFINYMISDYQFLYE